MRRRSGIRILAIEIGVISVIIVGMAIEIVKEIIIMIVEEEVVVIIMEAIEIILDMVRMEDRNIYDNHNIYNGEIPEILMDLRWDKI